MRWRFIAQRALSGEVLEWDLPLENARVRRALSGPGRLSGTVPVEVPRLVGGDGAPLLDPWGTYVWAEADGHIRGGGVLVSSQPRGPRWTLDVMGLSGYPQGQPWQAARYQRVQADPLDIVRDIWDWLQGSRPNRDLGVEVDDTSSPVRVGTREEDVDFTTGTGERDEFEARPFTLTWWETTDLGRVIDDLAEQSPFDYLEQSDWDGEEIRHRLRLGYPSLGRRVGDLRFVIGENVTVVPEVEEGEDYADEVMVLGAGEGRTRVRATRPNRVPGRIGRAVTVTDKTADTTRKAQARAGLEAGRRRPFDRISQITVTDHPHAPIGSWEMGDEIRITGHTGWKDLDVWARIVGDEITPGTDTAVLDLITVGDA